MSTDPRDLGGEISGPGGPYDRDAVVINTSRALIVDEQEVATMVNPSDGRRIVALLVRGRINKSTDRANVMLLESADGLAALVSEIEGVVQREGGELQREFEELLQKRREAMP